jgi:hypothetical protein
MSGSKVVSGILPEHRDEHEAQDKKSEQHEKQGGPHSSPPQQDSGSIKGRNGYHVEETHCAIDDNGILNQNLIAVGVQQYSKIG